MKVFSVSLGLSLVGAQQPVLSSGFNAPSLNSFDAFPSTTTNSFGAFPSTTTAHLGVRKDAGGSFSWGSAGSPMTRLVSEAAGSRSSTPSVLAAAAYPMSNPLQYASVLGGGVGGVAGTSVPLASSVTGTSVPLQHHVSEMEAKLKAHAEMNHQSDWNRQLNPAWKWDAYKASFDVQEGVPESGVSVAQRSLFLINTWFASLVDSEWINGLQSDAGSQPGRYTTFGTPDNPSKPIVPCPAGTPELVCSMTAERLSYRFPTLPQKPEQEEEYEYYFYQMLLREGYPGAGATGFGAAKRAPPRPGGEYEQRLSIGPSDFPTAPAQYFECEADVSFSIPFNLRDPALKMRARGHSIELAYYYACACDGFRMPIWSQCRMMLLNDQNQEDSLPPSLLPYPLMFYNAEFLDGMSQGHQGEEERLKTVEEFQPCGSFEQFDPDSRGCRTIIIPGYTPTPPLSPAMFAQTVPQYPQVQYDAEQGFVTDPYSCEIGVEIDFYFDSPVAWENAFVLPLSNLYYAQVSTLACLCDQLSNPILSSCRQAALDDYPIQQNYEEPKPETLPEDTRRSARFGRRLEEVESETLSADAVRAALKEAQEVAAAARDLSERSELLTSRAMAMVDKMESM